MCDFAKKNLDTGRRSIIIYWFQKDSFSMRWGIPTKARKSAELQKHCSWWFMIHLIVRKDTMADIDD